MQKPYIVLTEEQFENLKLTTKQLESLLPPGKCSQCGKTSGMSADYGACVRCDDMYCENCPPICNCTSPKDRVRILREHAKWMQSRSSVAVAS
jgi:hypothetical protein